MKKVLLIGDVHLGTSTFNECIVNVLEDLIEKIPDDVDDIIWVGDLIYSWKWLQKDESLHYIVKLFASRLDKFNHYLIMGNHDLLPKTQKSALTFLQYLKNVTVINEPFEYTKEILLVPHMYNGYVLEKKYNTVIAHLGLYGVDINKITYTNSDVLSWHKETKPHLTICGHIHASELLKTTDDITLEETIDRVLLGAIAPTNWGENYPRLGTLLGKINSNGAFDPTFTAIPLLHVTIEKDKNANIRKIIQDNEEICQEEYIEKVKPPTIRNKGNTIEEIVATVSKEQGVNFDAVMEYLKEIGLR